jgi:hypothetical protein
VANSTSQLLDLFRRFAKKFPRRPRTTSKPFLKPWIPGNELKKFWESAETCEYLAALENTLKTGELVDAKVGRNGGTWGHPKLAVFFARWLTTRKPLI